MANVEKFKINGPVASPSRPSVKLTALLVATIINVAHGISINPIAGMKFFKNGMQSLESGLPKKYHRQDSESASKI